MRGKRSFRRLKKIQRRKSSQNTRGQGSEDTEE